MKKYRSDRLLTGPRVEENDLEPYRAVINQGSRIGFRLRPDEQRDLRRKVNEEEK